MQAAIDIKPLASVDDMRHQLRKAARPKGRVADERSLDEVAALLGPVPSDDGYPRDLLIEFLHLLQDRYQALFKRHLAALAQLMRLSQAEVYEVATFYHHFTVLNDDEVAPEVTVRVCQSLSCTMAGSKPMMQRLKAVLGKSIRVVEAPCIGRCEQAPAALVGQHSVGCITPERIEQVLSGDTPDEPAYIGYEAYRQQGGYALADCVSRDEYSAEQAMSTLEAAGLRGLGGAGFPAGKKWRIVRQQAAPKLMAVNIDEGEPGTFKDRTYLEQDPHRFIEGMLIAAHVVQASAVYIYVRDEYHHARQLLQAELALLQANPPCPLPTIHLRRGAGAYICGEESAMIESIEGKRGEPRLRPPYIAEKGLFGRPTLEHNFETLYWVRQILEQGSSWFTAFGRQGRQGLRSFSVSGRVKEPGVKLAPAGISVRELIEEYCGGMQDGHELYAYLPGGASGGILPSSLDHLPLDFDTLQPYGCFIGSAAVVVLSQQDRARDAALNCMQFFAHESCGQCTPCRVGTDKAAQLMQASKWDTSTLDDLSAVMTDASICGLGQAAPNPVRCVQQYFAHEIN
jgi:formate dehydrogenase